MSAAAESYPVEPMDYIDEHPHLLAVVNPGSANYAAAQKQARRFVNDRFMDWHNDRLETDPDPAITEEKLHDKLSDTRRQYDAIVALTGDGGVNPIARYILLGGHGDSRILDMPVYLGGFGNANDGHVTTVGRRERGKVAKQPIVPIYPLEATLTSAAGSIERQVGLFYQGIGFTALASEMLNSDTHRKSWLHKLGKPGKLSREGLTILSALKQTQPFSIEDTWTGKRRAAYEFLVSHGPRMAKLRLFPGVPTSSEIKVVELSSKHDILSAAANLVLRTLSWDNAKGASFRIHTADLQTTVPFQFDGETSRLTSGTSVNITTSSRPLRMVAPRLAK